MILRSGSLALAGLILVAGTSAFAERVTKPLPAAAGLSEQAQSQAVPATPSQQEQEKEVRAYTLAPEEYQKAVNFARARYQLYFIDAIYGVIVLLLVLGWRLAPRYRNWAEGATRRRFLQAVIYAPLLLLTLGVLGLPTAAYDQCLSRKYGLSVQGWGSWFWDWTKGELIGFVLGIILVWILYGVIRRSARRWWLYFWLASLPILIFVLFISPWVIDPLFYKFEPLQPKASGLVTEVGKIVLRAGEDIPPERMYLMHASVKTKALDAYVTGIGASKRIVVFDTTLAKMTTPETVYVVGHEMGHYILGHIPKSIVFLGGVLLLLFYLGYRFVDGMLGRWGSRWAIRGLDDWASLPTLLLLLSIFSFLATPIVNAYSRYQEHQADVYGLEVTHGLTPNSSQEAARAFQVLGEVDLADPDPNRFIEFWLFTHDAIGERIQFSLTYDPWSKGEPPQFVK